ncbi:MAG: hypothetical protein GY845_16165 [Planctomycetes bacterium]|nr:hypothetical protein [Planctomycetota bacterium]
MKSADEIKKFFKSAAIDTNPKMDEAVLNKVLIANEKTTNPKSGAIEPNIRKIIMKSPITKVAAAAVIVVAVLIAMNQLGGSAGSVAWGEVVRNIEASPGFIFRLRQTYIREETGTIELYMMVYGSAQYGVRQDGYNDGDVTVQIYAPLSDGAMTAVDHRNRTYSRMALPDDARAEIESMDPKVAIREFLSSEYTKLGRKTIEGVETEGIEIDREPSEAKANFQVDSCIIQLWVSVDTGLPVLIEVETVGKNGTLEVHTIQDNFQWDVELDASEFKPNIPEDYTKMDVEIDADGKGAITPDEDEVTDVEQTRSDREEMKDLSQQGKKELLNVVETMTDGTLRLRTHLYKYELSDGRTMKMGEYAGGDFALDKAQWDELNRVSKAGPGEYLGTYEKTVEGRVFLFKRERYSLSDGTEVIESVGTLKEDQ